MDETDLRIMARFSALESVINQIEDYMRENVGADSNPILTSCGDEKSDSRIYAIRNAVAILMENASEDTKQKVREEFE